MKTLKEIIQEKLKITANTKLVKDKYVLIDAPAWSNYDYTTNKKFKDIFDNRIFNIYSYGGVVSTYMPVVLVKVSELQIIKDIYNLKKIPRAFELPDELPIDATDDDIKKFKIYNCKAWNYKDLKLYKY